MNETGEKIRWAGDCVKMEPAALVDGEPVHNVVLTDDYGKRIHFGANSAEHARRIHTLLVDVVDDVFAIVVEE